MTVESLESEIAALPVDDLASLGAWFDQYRERQFEIQGEITPEIEEAHREEVIWRKELYLAEPSAALPMDAAYFDEMRRSLQHA